MQKQLTWIVLGLVVAYLLLEGEIMSIGESLLDKWAAAIQRFEGWAPNSLSYRNNNPGNIKASREAWVGQVTVDDRGFVVFDNYEHGLRALKISLSNAASGKSSVYSPSDSLYDFFGKYAPDEDQNDSRRYAQFVAESIGVSPETQISKLV